MADIHIKRAHNLTQETARERVKAVEAKLTAQYGMKPEWKSQDQLAFAASGVKGTLEIKGAEIEVKVELGFMAKMLKGKIEEGINKTLDRELA
jgi:putative polyhydroxyalkanoate system protein